MFSSQFINFFHVVSNCFINQLSTCFNKTFCSQLLFHIVSHCFIKKLSTWSNQMFCSQFIHFFTFLLSQPIHTPVLVQPWGFLIKNCSCVARINPIGIGIGRIGRICKDWKDWQDWQGLGGLERLEGLEGLVSNCPVSNCPRTVKRTNFPQFFGTFPQLLGLKAMLSNWKDQLASLFTFDNVLSSWWLFSRW